MAKKVTELRIQRSVLRRVVQDKLQALLRGDFYVRNHLGEENYDPIVAEVKKLDEGVLLALMQHEKEQRSQPQAASAAAAPSTAQQQQQLHFSKELETFIQILAASIMIDASMRGENAGESDTRFIKKQKKMLTRMLMGGELYTLRREIVRFHLMNQRGVKDGSAELMEAIGADPPETEVEEEDDSNSSEEESEQSEQEAAAARPKKRKYNFSKNDNDDIKSVGTMDEDSSDEDDDDDDDDSLSDTATSENTNSLSKSGAEDGFSAYSATSSNKLKKAKKKARKEEKRRAKKERKRIRRERKEKKRKEKEEKKRKRKLEKELKKRKKMKHTHHHHSHGNNEKLHHDNAEFMEEEFDNDMDDADEVELDSVQMDGQEDDDNTNMLEEVASFEFKTKEEFEAYRDDIIKQIPKSVRKRFRHGGFSKWGKDWLPVIELGPFDVEPGPVRDMWFEMFHNVSITYIVLHCSSFICALPNESSHNKNCFFSSYL